MQPNDTCYYCGKPAVGDEHFPPKSFFPQNQRSRLVVVPACKEHNQEKSTDDEYVRTMLLYDIRADGAEHLLALRGTSRRAVERSFERSLERLKDSDPNGTNLDETLSRLHEIHEVASAEGTVAAMKELDALVKQQMLPSSLYALATKSPEPIRFTLPSGEEVDTVSTEIDVDRVTAYLSLGAHALYYYVFKTQHHGHMVLMPHFLMPRYDSDEAEQLEYFESLFDREQSDGDQKEYFYYRVIEEDVAMDDGEVKAVVINFCLYDLYKVTAIFIRPK
jgi:hypothetical protein